MRNEIDTDSESSKRNGDGTGGCAALHGRKGKLATRDEAGFLTIDGKNVGLCKNLQKILRFQCLDGCTQIQIRPVYKEIQCVTEREAGARSLAGDDGRAELAGGD